MQDNSNKKIINVIISIILLTSIVGFALVMAPKQSQDNNPNKPVPNEPVTLTYYAENINANVSKIFSAIKISGYTKEVNINVLNDKLFSVEGVSNIISSSYQNDPQHNLIYTAEITTKVPAEEINDLIERIKDSLGLTSIYAAKKALLKIPDKIKMFNADLNIDKNIEFGEPFTEGLVEKGTIAGDNIEISLVVKASGNKVLSRTAYETKNITLIKESISFSAEAPIKVLEKHSSLIFSGPMDYNGFKLSRLEDSLKQDLNNAKSVRVALGDFEPIAYLGVLKSAIKDKNSLKKSLKETIGTLAIVKQLDFNEDENKFIAKILVNGRQNYSTVVDVTKSLMYDFDYNKESFAFKPINVDVMGEIDFTKKQLEEEASKIEKILEHNGIFITVRQKTKVKLTEAVQYEGKSYSYDKNFVGLLLPKHTEGEEFVVDTTFITKRGEVEMAQAVENKGLIDILKEKPIKVEIN